MHQVVDVTTTPGMSCRNPLPCGEELQISPPSIISRNSLRKPGSFHNRFPWGCRVNLAGKFTIHPRLIHTYIISPEALRITSLFIRSYAGLEAIAVAIYTGRSTKNEMANVVLRTTSLGEMQTVRPKHHMPVSFYV